MKETKPRYWMWQQWRDDQGRCWAHPVFFETLSDARHGHANAADFFWVTKGMSDPSISSLYARDAKSTVELQQACLPGQDPRREIKVTSPPDGLGKVSSDVKAEAQRRDPGSSPGESTDLPF